ncbi:MAG: ABC transporter substrate-binding protein, partial [Prevotella sp.]|nr:ABC transporter substrate-binding protein [Prevotella sp.]
MGFVKKFVLLFVCCWLSSLCARGERFVLTPQWTAQAQFAGYYVAVAKGFYKRAGLDVKIEHISASNSCVNRLKNGT